MYLKFCSIKFYHIICSLFLLLPAVMLKAQLGTNATDTVYGLTTTGQITAINVNDAGSVVIGTPAASAANANGMGWSFANKKFYFFNQTGGGATEFISFNPIGAVKTVLTKPASPIIPTNQKIRSGTVTPDGNGYYTIFPGATTAMGYPVTNPAFYYYNIVAGTWTLVSQSFKNTSNTNVANISSLNSGDMAFDGAGNLWMIVSNTSDYALYRINAPIPTAANSIVNVDTIVSQRATPGGVSLTGIAFNASGILYMSSGSGVGVNNNRLYKLTSPAAPLVYMGTFTNSYGDDLTSTVYPNSVLPSVWLDFSANYDKDCVKLTWKVNESDNSARYNIEYSKDGSTWEEIASIRKDESGRGGQNEYNYSDTKFGQKTNYYRIVQVDAFGKKNISAIKMISATERNKILLWPNPAYEVLYIKNQNISLPYKARIYDKLGRMVLTTTLENASSSVKIGHLDKGWYMLKLSPSNAGEPMVTSSFIKQ